MVRPNKPWLVVAVLFTVVNLVGAVWAAAGGEQLHAAAHVGLTLLGTYFAWRLSTRTGPQAQSSVPLAEDRLEYLQQSMDAVAIEVERIGEAQRFRDKLESERAEPGR